VITRVRSREMLDVLLEAGADINAKSRWWAGGLDCSTARVPNWQPMPSNAARLSMFMPLRVWV